MCGPKFTEFTPNCRQNSQNSGYFGYYYFSALKLPHKFILWYNGVIRVLGMGYVPRNGQTNFIIIIRNVDIRRQ